MKKKCVCLILFSFFLHGCNQVAEPRWICTTEALTIYENPGFQSKTIGILKKNQTVTMLCMEPTGFAINGVEGSWMKIKTSYNLSGWVFSGYMKALKKAPVVQKHE